MKIRKPLRIGRLNIEAGWFRGNEFKLFSITIGDDARDCGFITIIDLQITKLSFSITWDVK